MDARPLILFVATALLLGCSQGSDSSSAPPRESPIETEPIPGGETPAETGSEPPDVAPYRVDDGPVEAAPPAPLDEPITPRSAGPRPKRSAPPSPPAAEPEPGGHRMQVFYATDRMPLDRESDGAAWSRFGPAIAAAVVALIAALCLTFLPRKIISAIVGGAALAGTIVLGQQAFVRGQQLARAAEFGDRAYGSDRHDEHGRPVLELGVCEVSLPPDHRVGQVESPSVLKLEFREDPQRHVILQRVRRVPDDEFYELLRTSVGESERQQAFVFIHGYNVAFDDAVKRTAQIAFDLKFDGAAICYSWPSRGGLAKYTHDEANIGWTVTQLETFLRDVAAKSEARTIHLVAHSMGNRALLQAIERLALRGGETAPRFGQVILAAPDVDTGEFRTRYAPALAQVAHRATLYASSNDRALIASTRVHGYDRLGLSGEHLHVVPGLETIDVSPIDTSLIGHSYYGDNPQLIRDLEAVVGLDLPAENREWLERMLLDPATQYWVFRQE